MSQRNTGEGDDWKHTGNREVAHRLENTRNMAGQKKKMQ